MRLLTSFLTPQFRYGSRQQAYWRGMRQGKISFKSWATHTVFEGMLPPLIWTLGSSFLGRGDWPKWWELVLAQVAWPASWIPIIGQIFSGTRQSVSLPALALFDRAQRTWNAGVKGGVSLLEGEDSSKYWTQLMLGAASLAEFKMGIPFANKAEIFMQGVEALDSGKSSNPLRLLIRQMKER